MQIHIIITIRKYIVVFAETASM